MKKWMSPEGMRDRRPRYIYSRRKKKAEKIKNTIEITKWETEKTGKKP
jgi:hypothetical protein